MPPSCCRRSWPWPGMLAIKKGAASLFLPIIEPDSTKAPDKYTVTFTLKEPSAIFLATVPEILVVNSRLVKKNEKDGDWGQAWLGKKVGSTRSHNMHAQRTAS